VLRRGQGRSATAGRLQATVALQAALARALGSATALDLVVAEISSPAGTAGGFRPVDAHHILRLIVDHLTPRLEVGEFLYPIGAQRLALLRTVDLESTEQRCQRLLVEVRRPLTPFAGRRVVPAAVFGIVRMEAAMAATTVLRLAQAALDAAHLEGPGGIIRHRPVVEDYLSLRRDLLKALPSALSGGQIDLVLEPVICLRTGAVTSARAQPRWLHARLGPVGAHELRAVARDSGQLRELEQRIVALALQDLRTGAGTGSMLPMTLALSAHALSETYFAERLRDACAQAGVRTDLLRIELDQQGPWPDPELLRERLHELDTTGIELVIGDINRWRLPLNHLLGLRLAAVECGMRWVREQMHEPRARAALGALVRVGHTLGGQVGAIEADTAQDLDHLRALRFDHARGAACGPALPLMDFLARTRAHNSRTVRIDPRSI
jgi:EAL domain-containing protein (putative c-di-GMP-specific phosphodiesterase class I)